MSDPLQLIEVRLHDRKADLLKRIEKVKKDITGEHSADWSEQAQERQNDEVLNALGNEARAELQQINRALERIAEGIYTTCSRCGGDIDIKRLEAVPYTDRCIRCAGQ